MDEKEEKEYIESLINNRRVIELAITATEKELTSGEGYNNPEILQEKLESLKKMLTEIEEKLNSI